MYRSKAVFTVNQHKPKVSPVGYRRFAVTQLILYCLATLHDARRDSGAHNAQATSASGLRLGACALPGGQRVAEAFPLSRKHLLFGEG